MYLNCFVILSFQQVTANTTKQMNKLVKKSILRATLLYTYAFLGGCIFYLIERKPEKNKEVYSRLSQELQREIVIQYNISINQSDFKRFMQRAFDAVTIGNKADWSILNGLTFTITSLTTIGKWLNGPAQYCNSSFMQVFTVLTGVNREKMHMVVIIILL